MTRAQLAPRAYEIADAYRAKGAKVVMGGFHPTWLPEEALGHADAVVVGEARKVIIPALKEKGYGFRTVSGLLGVENRQGTQY